jgi:outer membrane immunogenic protein
MMKRLALASLTIAFAAAPALAADMPVKAAPPLPPPVYSFTGMYFGGFAGGLWSSTNNTFVNPPPATISQSSRTGIGGGFIGAQAQWSNWLIGIEVGAGVPFGRNFGSGTCVPLAACAAGFTTTETLKNEIFTAGGRVGFAWDRWLIYGSGGGAFTDFAQGTCVTAVVVCPAEAAAGTFKGYYVGGGFDVIAWSNWIVGFEFRHYQFDSQGWTPVTIPGNALNPLDAMVSQLKFDTAVFRLTYLFGTPLAAPPVAAKY